jgi:hypothetical protein
MKKGCGLPAASQRRMIFSASLIQSKKTSGKYHPALRQNTYSTLT